MELNGKCVPQCEGCDHMIKELDDGWCPKFLCPEAKFRVGGGKSCGMATHLMTKIVEEGKVRQGQQKQKKKKV
jgi:hypothetical protein